MERESTFDWAEDEEMTDLRNRVVESINQLTSFSYVVSQIAIANMEPEITACCESTWRCFTSQHVRKAEPAIDMPMEHFPPPSGYNAPEQFYRPTTKLLDLPRGKLWARYSQDLEQNLMGHFRNTSR
ncbi:unnamed protein product [Ilex paraguariensis]|uniref:Uncharacterized protein n=1 Tax=Ilex paraguariensis TaxID=185542 RepID=A0ABC8SIQ9_9AQUA